MKLKNIFLAGCFGAQAFIVGAQDKAPENWFNLDNATDNVQGVSTEKAYKELLKDKKPKKKIVVAVIDSGVDEEHEDLKDVMWVNKGEVIGNGKDDDGNGYIDDIYGWNFIGGKDGKNVNHDSYELTRVYSKLKSKKRNKKEEALYKEVKKVYDEKVGGLQGQMTTYKMVSGAMDKISEALGKEEFTLEDVEKMEVKEGDAKMEMSKTIVKSALADNDSKGLRKELKSWYEYLNNSLEYGYNEDFNPRTIVGDDYENVKDRNYGNNDITGPDAGHGTHVAGIIAATRTNDLGMKGVANNVSIMGVRAVPNGDERDKDVANAIIYAVDNGANVINMSFGKGYPYNKKAVDKAIKYALKKNVLLVHAAGNSAENTDETANYPSKYFGTKKKKTAANWLEVGALSWKPGVDAPATFSNYGAENVDVFAPGVDIYSTTPGSEYDSYSGTSMASPVTAGVAALVWSYYPELKATQIREIIVKSVIKNDKYVNIPGGGKQVEFKELCNTSGVVSAYEALKLAEKMTSGK
ncbi:MAG: S8 family serine peptidase [Aureispira sp.]|nr:S8 family serine peptidase [Aureispira sp.]